MILPKFILLLSSLVSLSYNLHSQTSGIQIVTPTIQQEATSIWRTINNYNFYEQQGYTIHLPKHTLIDSLITKSKNGTFGNGDFPASYRLVETKVFDIENYQQAIQKVEFQRNLINNLINEIANKKSEWDWEFKMFDTYKVVFTLYGTGGSYDPDLGVITILTTKEGEFMNYTNPANTLIHEIVHMGIEYSIVQKYNLNHGLKERVVDNFVYILFQKKLPEYKIQNMGNNSINSYLRNKNDIKSLDIIISEFVNR